MKGFIEVTPVRYDDKPFPTELINLNRLVAIRPHVNKNGITVVESCDGIMRVKGTYEEIKELIVGGMKGFIEVIPVNYCENTYQKNYHAELISLNTFTGICPHPERKDVTMFENCDSVLCVKGTYEEIKELIAESV